MNERAIVYRASTSIPAEWGTAVNVQAMVFGNMGDDLRHRRGLHPRPGHRREQVLRRVPDERPGRGRRRRHPHAEARSVMKTTSGCQVHAELWVRKAAREALQGHAGLRVHHRRRASSTCCRPVTASAPASPRCGSLSRWSRKSLIDQKTAVKRIPADDLDQLLVPVFDPKAKKKAKIHRRDFRPPAWPVLPPARSYFTAEKRSRGRHAKGETSSSCRVETSRRTSRHDRGRRHPHRTRRHDLARGTRRAPDGQGLRMWRADVVIDYGESQINRWQEGQGGRSSLHRRHDRRDLLRAMSIDGSIRSHPGARRQAQGQEPTPVQQLRHPDHGWADKYRKLGVRTNADTPARLKNARPRLRR